jgi:hypothetical protein
MVQPAESWHAWTVFLGALDTLPIPDPADVALYRRATGRQQWPTTPASAAYVTVGRRSGKSRIASLLAIYAAAFTNWKARTAPGETAIVATTCSPETGPAGMSESARGAVLPESSPLAPRELQPAAVRDKCAAGPKLGRRDVR